MAEENAISHSAKRRLTQRGQAALFVTLTTPVLFGLLGFGVEVGWAYWRREACKTAAESAVWAIVSAAGATAPATQGATPCPGSPSAATAWQLGCLFAAQNGFTNGSKGASVTVQIGAGATGIPVSGVSPGNYWAAVTVSETENALFSRMIGGSGLTVKARATAGVFAAGSGACIYVTDPTDSKTFNMSGANLTGGCGINVNSSSASAVNISGGNLTLNSSAKLTIDGGLSWSGGNICGNAPPTVPACVNQNTGKTVANPFSGMVAPTPSAGCDYTNYSVSGGSSNVLSPGTYCGDLKVSGGTGISFSSGVYILKTGNLVISGGVFSNTATNVLFYIPTSNASGQFNITGASPVWNGISGNGADGFLFWADNSAAQSITGGNYTFNGVIYMPNSSLSYSGGNGTQQSIVAYKLTVTGGNITSNYPSGNYSGGGVSGAHLVE